MSNVYSGIDIVSEARKEIKKEQLINDVPHITQMNLTPYLVDHISGDRLHNNYSIDVVIAYLRTAALIIPQQSIGSKKPGIVGSLFIFVKKIIQKMMSFYIGPIVHEQNKFNLHIVDALEFLEQEITKRDEIIKGLTDK